MHRRYAAHRFCYFVFLLGESPLWKDAHLYGVTNPCRKRAPLAEAVETEPTGHVRQLSKPLLDVATVKTPALGRRVPSLVPVDGSSTAGLAAMSMGSLAPSATLQPPSAGDLASMRSRRSNSLTLGSSAGTATGPHVSPLIPPDDDDPVFREGLALFTRNPRQVHSPFEVLGWD